MYEIPFETPVQRLLLPAFDAKGLEVWVKRDDMIHPFISGNKWRKLKYALLEAKQQKKTHLLSFGGAWSNHLLALACAGAQFRFKTTGIVRGEEVHNPMMEMCRMFGMDIRFVSREQFRLKELGDQIPQDDDQMMIIQEGGKGEAGVMGCEEILADVPLVNRVFCAVGTGTTLAGISRAAQRQGMLAEGICVLKGAGTMDAEIEAMSGTGIKVHHRFHRGGYAKSDPDLMECIYQTASETGILFDQVYTGKMLLGVMELAEENYFRRGESILLIHTGGLMGLLSTFNRG